MTFHGSAREAEFAEAVSKYLFDAGGSASISQIRHALPNYISLSAADRRKSPTRPGEDMWEQIVRNIVCHRHCLGNAVSAGNLIYSPRKLSLSDRVQLDLFENDKDEGG
ncbi:MAG: hypothetical protein H6915_06005 [Novosphingobium sp.]|nr:hypothetical protein [Novosphingobium sp.]MCP5389303.1 hypothetical protein [Novosphingobium sp.]